MTDPIESLAYKLAVKAKSWNEEITIPPEVISYHLAIWLNYYGVMAASLIIGLLTGTLLETIIAFFTLSLLRATTGGEHAPTLTACFVISLFTIVMAAHVTLPFGLYMVIVFYNLATIIWYNRNKDNKAFAYGSIAMVVASVFLISPAMAVAAFAQCLSLVSDRR